MINNLKKNMYKKTNSIQGLEINMNNIRANVSKMDEKVTNMEENSSRKLRF